jgi:hypothetical protein
VAKFVLYKNITFTHSIHQIDFPTFVYPWRTMGTTVAALRHLFVNSFDFVF